jgi:hypothetical protein
MYKVGIVVNENEVSHSKYADTLKTFRKAIDGCNKNGKNGNSYYFKEFDKFNIQSLFDEGENNIKSFDSIIIATNAMDTERINDVLIHNKKIVEEFINDNKGIFISSQKKRSNGSLTEEKFQSVGFLPDIYDYYIFDRPEKYSSEGIINIASENRILFYPNRITNEIIADHCENNEFIVHRYRSVIIPKHPNAYDTLLNDASLPISQKKLGYSNGDRKVLLSSKYKRRIVLSSMALDWANHTELLCNILTFITENKTPAFFVKKDTEPIVKSSVIESYIIRANIANLPYRVISENEIAEYSKFSGSTFIFSPKWSTKEIEKKYDEMLLTQKKYFSLYHISKSSSYSVNDLKLSKYCNFSSIDKMKDEVIQKILSEYVSNSWHKSVWTYSYIINLIKFFDIDIPVIAKGIYEEMIKHFTKKDEHNGKVELVGNYDNVFNATCKMAEILSYFQDKYQETVDKDSQYKIDEVLKQTDEWVISKIESSSISDQDICYGVLYLLSCEGYRSISDFTKIKLSQLIDKILAETIQIQIDETPTIDLCRIYQATCQLLEHGIFTDKKYTQYLKKIEIILSERQDLYGNWKNLSETSEIVVMLMNVYAIRTNIDSSLNALNIVITKAVEILHSQFNSISNSWGDDLNTNAKAMNGVGAYNKIFNFAINDFFLDLNHHQTNVALMSGTDIGIIDGFYRNIDALEKEKVQLTKNIFDSENKILFGQKKLRISKMSSLIAVLMVFSLLFLSALLLHGLFTNHKEILSEIFNRYKEAFIGGFIALGLTIVWELIFNRLKKE